jgi:outer membrane immunogenic protein
VFFAPEIKHMGTFAMKRLLIAGVLAGLSPACADAADLGPYGAPPPPGNYYEPVRDMPWSWRGFYVGLNTGYAWGGDDTVTLSGSGIGTASGSLSPSGWFGGGQIGYNAQFQSLVFGIEADLQGSNISDSFGGPIPGSPYFAQASTKVDWFSTIRGRVGYAAGPALLYATGGFAFANVDTEIAAIGPGTSVSFSNDQVKTGYTVGGGIEWAFAPNWSLRSEYLYVNLGDQDFTAPGGYAAHTETDFHTVRMGLNYRF